MLIQISATSYPYFLYQKKNVYSNQFQRFSISDVYLVLYSGSIQCVLHAQYCKFLLNMDLFYNISYWWVC